MIRIVFCDPYTRVLECRLKTVTGVVDTIDLEKMDRQLLSAFFIIPYSMFRPLVSHKVCWLFTSGLPVLSVAYACDRLDLQVPRAIFSIMWRYI